MTTLVDVISVGSLDAGSIPATSTSLGQGFGLHASVGRSLVLRRLREVMKYVYLLQSISLPELRPGLRYNNLCYPVGGHETRGEPWQL